ncbi:MAG TPA: hypothetical protein VLG27_03320 [Candidatus Saccharimonadia bacterium]|nr:hypothetical protein [Candidatus Saccharimonadia bacterium]
MKTHDSYTYGELDDAHRLRRAEAAAVLGKLGSFDTKRVFGKRLGIMSVRIGVDGHFGPEQPEMAQGIAGIEALAEKAEKPLGYVQL